MDVTEKDAILNLCNAIIEKACDDYSHDKKRCTQFFQSEWFVMLSRGSIAGDTILKWLESGERKPIRKLPHF